MQCLEGRSKYITFAQKPWSPNLTAIHTSRQYICRSKPKGSKRFVTLGSVPYKPTYSMGCSKHRYGCMLRRGCHTANCAWWREAQYGDWEVSVLSADADTPDKCSAWFMLHCEPKVGCAPYWWGPPLVMVMLQA